MNNLIEECFVIRSVELGIEPVIYLERPKINFGQEFLFACSNVFEAARLIKHYKSEAKIKIVGHRSMNFMKARPREIRTS